MPRLKKAQKTEARVKVWDKKADKCGVLHTVYSVNGDEYTGEWLENKKHGKGTQVWKKAGLIYDGEWRFGKREGFGTLRKFHCDEYVRVYVGEWKDHKKEGFGTQFYGPNSYYEGQWAEHKRSGWGRIFYPNGEFYEGEWLNDKPHGQGMLRLVSEDRYEGSWKDGRKHGHGRYFYVDKGQLYDGFWVDDILKCGTLSDLGRERAANPPMYPIPQVELMDAEGVLLKGLAEVRQKE